MNPFLAQVALPLALLAWSAAPLTASPDGGALIVLNKSDDTASIIDPASGATRMTLPTGPGPHEVAVSPDGKFAVVADYGHQVGNNTLTVFDLESLDLHKTIDLGEFTRPHGITFLGRSGERLLVTAEDQRALLEVVFASGEVRDVFATDQDVSHMVVAAPDGRHAYVSNIGSGSVTVIDVKSGERLANIPTGAGAEGLDIAPDGSEVWIANRSADTISILDTKTHAIVQTLECAQFPIRLEFTPDGKHALVSNAQSGDVAVFDRTSRELLRRIPMVAEASEGDENRLFQAGFSEGPVPIGILIEPSGRRAYIANTNANLVTILDLESWSVAGRIQTGQQPDGLGWFSPSLPSDTDSSTQDS